MLLHHRQLLARHMFGNGEKLSGGSVFQSFQSCGLLTVDFGLVKWRMPAKFTPAGGYKRTAFALIECEGLPGWVEIEKPRQFVCGLTANYVCNSTDIFPVPTVQND